MALRSAPSYTEPSSLKSFPNGSIRLAGSTHAIYYNACVLSAFSPTLLKSALLEIMDRQNETEFAIILEKSFSKNFLSLLDELLQFGEISSSANNLLLTVTFQSELAALGIILSEGMLFRDEKADHYVIRYTRDLPDPAHHCSTSTVKTELLTENENCFKASDIDKVDNIDAFLESDESGVVAGENAINANDLLRSADAQPSPRRRDAAAFTRRPPRLAAPLRSKSARSEAGDADRARGSNKRKVRCPYCSRLCAFRALDKHIRNKHTEKTLCCDKCEKMFGTQQSLTTHFKFQHDPESKICPTCGQEFATVHHMRLHVRVVHEKKEFFQCPTCPTKIFSLKESLDKHIRRDHNKSKAPCDFCGKLLNIKYLIQHIKEVHTEEKDLKCPSCDKYFASVKGVNDHNRKVHAENKSEQEMKVCNVCGKHLTGNSGLRTHMKAVHEKSYSRACELCGNVFTTSRTLRKHMACKHGKEREKPHACGHCGKHFYECADLRTHVEAVHEKKRNFSCDVCGKAFGFESVLRTHKRGVHGVGVDARCERCGQTFNYKSQYKTHVESGKCRNAPAATAATAATAAAKREAREMAAPAAAKRVAHETAAAAVT